jgi:hypothetical protein
MKGLKKDSFIRLFQLPSLFFVASVTGVVLTSIGLWQAAIGFGIGVMLYMVNLFFLYEGNRSLISARSPRSGRIIATISGIGRKAFLAVSLAFLAQFWFPALIATCGGLLAGQVNFQLSLLIQGGISKKWLGL